HRGHVRHPQGSAPAHAEPPPLPARVRAALLRPRERRARPRDARDGRPMKSLVTGGAGFIGRWVVARLLERGDEVLVLDDLSNGRRENLRDFEGKPGYVGL